MLYDGEINHYLSDKEVQYYLYSRILVNVVKKICFFGLFFGFLGKWYTLQSIWKYLKPGKPKTVYPTCGLRQHHQCHLRACYGCKLLGPPQTKWVRNRMRPSYLLCKVLQVFGWMLTFESHCPRETTQTQTKGFTQKFRQTHYLFCLQMRVGRKTNGKISLIILNKINKDNLKSYTFCW